jgi:hypothetical protein
MSATMGTSTTHTPDWLVSEMPAGYQTRFAEIQRLSAEMHAMDQMARLLWETGAPLQEAVRDTLASLKLEIDPVADSALGLAVRIDHKRRLLIHVATAESAIEKKSPELASVFKLLHEIAHDDDRVVLVTNTDRSGPPKGRPSSVTEEAGGLLKRLGVNVLPTTTLFGLWTISLQEPQRARAYLEKLHAQDGGPAPMVS